jgi:glycosyltransferase involved in cell wall biosynthesis
MVSLSIALPVHNGELFLEEALCSILSQSDEHFEVVVSDNGSTDETPEILRRYSDQDGRVRVFRTDSLLPQIENLNRVVQLCNGDWVQLVCHDDLLLPDCVATLRQTIGKMSNSKVGLIGHGPGALFSNGHVYLPPSTDGEVQCWPGHSFIRQYLSGCHGFHLPALTTAAVRKSAFVSLAGFDSKYQHCDTFLWLRLLLSWDYIYLSRALTLTRIHGNQDTATIRKSLRSARDHAAFWPSFIRANRKELKLNASALLKAGVKPLTAAGTAVAVELLKRRYGIAASMILQLPPSWWPLMPLFVIRSWRRHKAQMASWNHVVPVDVLFP